MIWQEKVHIVAMVTNLKEDKKIKCQQYWPEGGSKNFGPFIVTTTDQQVFADYTIRLLQIQVCIYICVIDAFVYFNTASYIYCTHFQLQGSSEHSRVVTHYHFTSWPDHDVPEYATSILTYHHRISRDYKPSKGPMVVHCR